MAVFKCKMCGGTLEFNPGDTVAVCDSCGTKQTLPRLDDDRRANLFGRADHFRKNTEFDKAIGIYEQILNEDDSDAEAYWGLLLCRYGIEYVEDPQTHKRIPTVNRAQFTSIFDDEDYKEALAHADGAQRQIYQEEAETINEIQKGILAISEKEEPFDVFICYKETDANGRRTPDSVLANDLYHQLTQEGFKVFFSRITLEDKLGTAYEPYIFAALNSAKVMVVIGTKPEYFNAVWVKNEWSRYLALVKTSGGKKVLIPAYKDMDPYDLPEEFSHLQAQDMSKLGFMQDLIRGIKKLTVSDTTKSADKEVVMVNNGNGNVDPLLRRVFMFLEDGNWADADSYCEKVLDQDPENAEAYIGKLMAELHVQNRSLLGEQTESFAQNNNYQKAVRFSDDITASELQGYIDRIKNRKNEKVYSDAVSSMEHQNYDYAIQLFESLGNYKDSQEQTKECVYQKAVSYEDGTIKGINTAINTYKSISGFKDVNERIKQCEEIIERLRIEQEKAALEAERKAQAQTKTLRRVGVVLISLVLIAVLGYFIAVKLILPMKARKEIENSYNEAMVLLDNGQYAEAYHAFESLDYEDSKDKAILAKYLYGKELLSNGKYESAYNIFKTIITYEDSYSLYEETTIKWQIESLQKISPGSNVVFGFATINVDSSEGPIIETWLGNPLIWKVVAVEDNRALLLYSGYINDIRFNTTTSNNTWAASSLRSWLNTEFYNKAFSDTLKEVIIETTVPPATNPSYDTDAGPETEDRVFILSIDEVLRYGVEWNTWSGPVWLRSPGKTSGTAAQVHSSNLDYKGVGVTSGLSIKPAIWIDLDAVKEL